MAKLKGGTRVYGGLTVDSALTVADVTISGNLIIQGTTTTVDTTTTTLVDPLIELGGGEGGAALTVNDGKERGLLLHTFDTANSAAVDGFMGWHTSAGEFVLAKSVTNSGDILSIGSYGNVHAGHFLGEGDTLGNITGANVTGTVLNANTAAYAGDVLNAAQSNITSLGILSNVSVSGTANLATVTSSGTVTFNNTTEATSTTTGALKVAGGASIAANLHVGGNIYGNFAGNIAAKGSNTQIQFNDEGAQNATSGLTFSKTDNSLTATGTITGGNLSTGGTVDATGTITGGNLSTAGTVSATGNVSGGNLTTAGDVTTVTLTASGNISTTANLNVTANASVTGTATVGDLTTGGNITGSGGSSTANVSYLEVRTTANITSTATVGNLSTAGTVDATSTITGGNLTTAGRATVGNLTMSTGAAVTGHFLPSADVTYDLGADGSAWRDLWLSGSSIKLGTQTISSNVGGVSLSNTMFVTDVTASNLVSTLTLSASGAIIGANVTANNLTATQVVFADADKKLTSDTAFTFITGTGELSATLLKGTLSTAAQPNVTSVGTLTDLTVSNVATANINGYASTVSGAAQANITSLGNLTVLTVDGDAEVTGTLTTPNVSSATSLSIASLDGGITFTSNTSTIEVSNSRITGLATPTQATDAATKGYVDGAAQGLDIKESVRAATTANITLSGTQTVDGVSLVAGNRVLVKNQTTASQNGIYVVVDGGAWTRAVDADATGELTAGSFTFVEEGTAQSDSGWVVSTNGTIALGTDPIAWTQFSGAGQLSADHGLALNGGVFSALTDEVTLTVLDGNLAVKAGAVFTTPVIGVATGTSLDLGTGAITANGAALFSINGGNVSEVALATTVTASAQSAITSVGTLDSLTVAGEVSIATGAVVANSGGIYTDGYYYANGDAIDFQTAAGSEFELQFHAANVDGAVVNDLASSANLTFNGTALVITGTANVSSTLKAANLQSTALTDTKITMAGTDGVLKDSGLTFNTFNQLGGYQAVFSSSVEANGVIDKSLTIGQITFAGATQNLAGSANLAFDASAKLLSTDNANLSGYLTAANVTARNLTSGRVTLSGASGLLDDSANLTFNTGTQTLTTDNASLSGTVTAGFFSGNGSSLTSITGAEVTGTVANANVAVTVSGAAQTAITSVGTLTSLIVSGTTDLGAVGNVTLTGGSSGDYLKTDGSGALSWGTISSDKISNGTSNVSIPAVNGNVILVSNGNTVLTITGTGANVTGYIDVTGNISGDNITAATSITVTDGAAATDAATGAVTVAGGIAATGNIYTGSSVGFANNNGGTDSKAYIQFNSTANSLDFIFN